MSFCPESDPEHSERRPYIPNPRFHTRPGRTHPPRLLPSAVGRTPLSPVTTFSTKPLAGGPRLRYETRTCDSF